MANLKPNKRRAIAALLSTPNVRAAAQAAKVGERTLHRWLAEDVGFQIALSQAEGQLVGQAGRHLLALQEQALDRLEGILTSPTVKPRDLLRAVTLALEYSLRVRELSDIEERLIRLEQRNENH